MFTSSPVKIAASVMLTMLLVLAPAALVHADPWPLAVQSDRWITNYVPSGGSIGECATNFNGSFGSVFFTNTNADMSWGGTCNATNNRPPGWLGSLAGYSQGGVQYVTGWYSNTGWSYFSQITMSRVPTANWYISQSAYFLSDAAVVSYSSWWFRA